jgi:hypothetical protein
MTDGLVLTTSYQTQDGAPLYDTNTQETIVGDTIVSITPPIPVQILGEAGASMADESGDYLLEG